MPCTLSSVNMLGQYWHCLDGGTGTIAARLGVTMPLTGDGAVAGLTFAFAAVVRGIVVRPGDGCAAGDSSCDCAEARADFSTELASSANSMSICDEDEPTLLNDDELIVRPRMPSFTEVAVAAGAAPAAGARAGVAGAAPIPSLLFPFLTMAATSKLGMSGLEGDTDSFTLAAIPLSF